VIQQASVVGNEARLTKEARSAGGKRGKYVGTKREQWKRAMRKCVSMKDMRKFIYTLKGACLKGDLEAMRLMLGYTLGPMDKMEVEVSGLGDTSSTEGQSDLVQRVIIEQYRGAQTAPLDRGIPGVPPIIMQRLTSDLDDGSHNG